MTVLAKRKPYPQQLYSICHFSIIKIIIVHQLTQLVVSWETFISHECFKGLQIFSDPQEEGEPSRQQRDPEVKQKRLMFLCLLLMKEALG